MLHANTVLLLQSKNKHLLLQSRNKHLQLLETTAEVCDSCSQLRSVTMLLPVLVMLALLSSLRVTEVLLPHYKIVVLMLSLLLATIVKTPAAVANVGVLHLS